MRQQARDLQYMHRFKVGLQNLIVKKVNPTLVKTLALLAGNKFNGVVHLTPGKQNSKSMPW